MKRTRALVSALVVLSLTVPAHAGGVEHGRIMFPSGSPQPARTAWQVSHGMNGVIGWVFRVDPSADEAPYALSARASSGIARVAVYFYADGRNEPGAPCDVSQHHTENGVEYGTICPGPRVPSWGVAVLEAGFDARFTLSY